MTQRNHEDLLLWDAASALIRSEYADLAVPVVRKAIESSFSMIQEPLEFLGKASIKTPTVEQLHSLKAFDCAIQQALKHQNFDEVGERYDQYVEALQEVFEEVEGGEMKKKLFGQLLRTSYQSNTASGFVHEQASPYITAEPKAYTTTEAAEIIHVSGQTIRRMCEKGKFPDAYKTEGGHWRVPQKYFRITFEQARQRKKNTQPLIEKAKKRR